MLQRQFGIILLLVLPQMNSKASVQLLIVCVQYRHLTLPHQYLMIYGRKVPVGRGWVLFLWLVGFDLRVCACVCRFLGWTSKFPESAWESFS